MLNFSFRQSIITKTVFLILFSITTFSSFPQSEKLYHSLDYINIQFKKFNTYNLQFQLDVEKKILISKSIYFEVTYPIDKLSSIYCSKRGDKDCIVFFKCENEDQCISSINLKDKNTEFKTEYSFNLEANSDIAEKVVVEFMSIKNGIDNTNIPENSKPIANNANLNADIEYINRIMKIYNLYKLQYSIDLNKKVLQSRSNLYEVSYNPSKLNNVELISRGDQDFIIKFTCKNDETCLKIIDLKNKKTELKDNYSVNFTGNETEAKKLITIFNHLLQNIK